MTTTTDAPAVPTLGKIVRHSGTAGQFAVSVLVTYPGERGTVITFTSSSYGGPIVMSSPAMPRGVFVSADVLDRIGRTLSPDWVRAFFA